MKYIKKYENFENSDVPSDKLKYHLDIGRKITCDNCKWSWKTETDDDRKALCHKCGYDNELGRFDILAFKKWKRENPDVKLQFKEGVET